MRAGNESKTRHGFGVTRVEPSGSAAIPLVIQINWSKGTKRHSKADVLNFFQIWGQIYPFLCTRGPQGYK
jgi:hypothetical protein